MMAEGTWTISWPEGQARPPVISYEAMPCYWRDGWPQSFDVRWPGRGLALELGVRAWGAFRTCAKEDG